MGGVEAVYFLFAFLMLRDSMCWVEISCFRSSHA